ncbi:MAG: hypothetical protein OEW42_00545 [Acidimicrobiia bacterium]|nr:hypothetical protein [Acidimicrobiia bacterium]
MLSLFDDYPVHQTPDPIAVPASSDRDVYERYWFNGYSSDASTYLGVATAYYPHLGIKDCGISFVIDGVQHAFHASARATDEPTDLQIGPFRLEIVEPMRSCRLTLDDNETGWKADLLFQGRTANIEEPRHTWMHGLRRVMDTTRFTQLGHWTGSLTYGEETIHFTGTDMPGTKDRSWGLRPLVGGDPRGAPPLPRETGLFFLWAPLHFDDLGVHYQLFEDTKGRPLYTVGAFLPVYDSIADLPGVEDPGATHMRNLEHRVTFSDTSRMIETAQLAFTSIDDGTRHEIEFEKQFTYRMKGIGYSHPEWGHGQWKGEVAVGAEQWSLDSVDDTSFENQHVQHLMKVRMGERTGVGVLEQNILGPYRPYGLTGAIRPPG